MTNVLAKEFSAEEWDCWLNVIAHCYAPESLCDDCPAWCKMGQWCLDYVGCPVCRFFHDCRECRGANCGNIPHEDRADRLIERLYREGVFV
jgi:hypothetical protein